MKRLAIPLITALMPVCSQPLHAETFDNASIVTLSKAGVGDGVLLAKIASLPCGYDVSTPALITLRGAGVSGPVVTAMVNRCQGAAQAQGVADAFADPMAKRAPGLYIAQPEGAGPENGRVALRLIRPVASSGMKASGNGSLLFPTTMRIAVSQPSAQTLALSPSPSFWFYFDPSDKRTEAFGGAAEGAAQSPSEFVLVRFVATADGQRQLIIGKSDYFRAKVGIDPRQTVDFKVSDMGDGIFRVDLPAPLAPGQYAFVLRAGIEAVGNGTAGSGKRGRGRRSSSLGSGPTATSEEVYRIYDFAVK